MQLPKGWNQGDYYMSTRYLERSGMPILPNSFDYASITDEDLEHGMESWEATAELLNLSSTQTTNWYSSFPSPEVP